MASNGLPAWLRRWRGAALHRHLAVNVAAEPDRDAPGRKGDSKRRRRYPRSPRIGSAACSLPRRALGSRHGVEGHCEATLCGLARFSSRCVLEIADLLLVED